MTGAVKADFAAHDSVQGPAVSAFRTRLGMSEHRYRTYWTHTPEGLFIVEVLPDGSFRLEALNPAHERATGLLTENVAGQPIEQCLDPRVVAAVTPRYRQCVEVGRPIHYQELLDLPAGFRHWETSLAPVRDTSGRIAWLLGTARNVTDRVVLQEALTESEAKFRMLAETVPDIIFSASKRGVADYRNRRYYDYTGVKLGAEPPPLSELHPNDRRKVRRMWPSAVRKGLLTVEVRIRGADRSYRWFLLRATRLDTPQGHRWFGVATDIHEVKAAAEIQQDLNDRLESVLASISDGYYTLDRDWRLTSINPKAAAWFGVPAAQLIGADVRRTLKDLPPLAKQIGAVLEGGKANQAEHVSAYRPDRVIEAHTYPSKEGASVFFRDVTDRHNDRRSVEQARGLLQSTVDSLSAFIAILDDKGVIIAVNNAWREALRDRLQMIAGDGVGMPYVDICTAANGDEGPEVQRGIRAVIEGRRDSFRYIYCYGDDAPQWLQVVLRRFDHEGERRTVVAHQDITDATLAQRSLREAAERLLDLQEEERRRVAVELHDSTGQHLVALSLAVARLKALNPETKQTAPLYQDIRESLDEAQRELRVFSYLLHPPYLEEAGLAESLRKFLRGFALRSGLLVTDRIDLEIDRADLAVRRSAFRIVQEAISNVHRHAAASTVKVELWVDERLHLRVTDDGRGLPSADLEELPLGVGVAGMRDRVRQLGGEISITSPQDGENRGVVVDASLPLSAS